MKTKRSTRFLSALLAFVMVALLIPFGVLPTIAGSMERLEADTLDALGKGYNLLGGEILSRTSISIQDIIVDLNDVPAYRIPGTTEIGYSYSYITSMQS